jgi:hypothetical protein
MKVFWLFASILLMSATNNITAQSDLDSLLDELMEEETRPVLGTFFGTRIIHGQSVFMMPKKGLDFRVAHRFGEFNSGFNNFYGLDQSSSYFSLEYGFFNRFTAGIGRATYNRTINGYAKYAIVQQTEGPGAFPLSIVYHGSTAMNATIYDNKERNQDWASRMDYTHQLLIASKIGPSLSLQITPTMVHRNLVKTPSDVNDLYALGFGGRYKIRNSFSVNFEYFKVFNHPEGSPFSDPIAIGVDIQLSAHVFQIHVTNSEAMTENGFIGYTTGNFFKNMRPGFNISQVFTIGK